MVPTVILSPRMHARPPNHLGIMGDSSEGVHDA